MSIIDDKCAELAAKLSDAEIVTFLRVIRLNKEMSPYQRAVAKEAERRGISVLPNSGSADSIF